MTNIKPFIPPEQRDMERPRYRVLDPTDPLPAATAFLLEFFTREGVRTLHHHAGEFFEWGGAAYLPADESAIRAQLYRFLADSWTLDRRDQPVPFKPTSTKVANVLDALKAASNLPSNVEPPAWLDGLENMAPPAHEMLACRNGILHLPTSEMRAPTPLFWTRNGLGFEYDAAAPPPSEWLKFLRSIWPDDDEAIDTLQEIFGYLLTPDTVQQKIFLIVGPKRSGKGTIARVLQALLGKANVTAPTLAGLSQNFGLQPLIGKTAAIISDARLGGKADQQAIAERLLSISGEDAMSVPRKFMDDWTGQLHARFLILTNELPRLTDASGALASRFITLSMTESFFGKEDHGLTARLLEELPGVLNWSIDGWMRLQERGYFVQPESSREAMEDLEALGSPVKAFIRDKCVIEPGAEIGRTKLFEMWKAWCSEQGRERPGNQASFGRDLHAAFPWVQSRQERGGPRYYVGLREGL